MAEQGLTHHALAEELAVNVKTIERWVTEGPAPLPAQPACAGHAPGPATSPTSGRTRSPGTGPLPCPRARSSRSTRAARTFPATSGDNCSRPATHEIGDPRLRRALPGRGRRHPASAPARRRKPGSRIRILLGDPSAPTVAEPRSWRKASATRSPPRFATPSPCTATCRASPDVEFRLHRTVLYNSIYRADDRLFVNTHIYGLPAAQAPVWYLRKIPGGELAQPLPRELRARLGRRHPDDGGLMAATNRLLRRPERARPPTAWCRR